MYPAGAGSLCRRRVIRRFQIPALLLAGLLATIVGCAPARAPSTAPATAHAHGPYEAAIQRFERMDRENPPSPGGTLFVGSSTFTRWTDIPAIFAEFNAANRAFGGSVIADQLREMDRFILPRKPAKIVFYCGDNDIKNGDSPQQVLANYRAFVARIHSALPETKIYFVAIKICRARFHLVDKVRGANDLVRAYCQSAPDRLKFIDINPAILDESGQPITSLYVADELHLNADGYARIAPVIRNALRDSAAVPKSGFIDQTR